MLEREKEDLKKQNLLLQNQCVQSADLVRVDGQNKKYCGGKKEIQKIGSLLQ